MQKSFLANARPTRHLIFIVFFACFHNSFSQHKAAQSLLAADLEWSDGSILTNDGKELVGVLRYNNKSGLVSFEQGNKSLTFTARGVVAFEFFDEKMQKQRLFYSFSYEDPKSQGVTRPQFFEALMEFKDFALLSKIDPIEIEHKDVYSAPFHETDGVYTRSYLGSNVEVSQKEAIFLMSSDGTIMPYVRIEEIDIDGYLYDRTKTKNKILDKNLLTDILGKDISGKLENFASENKLSFRDKNDLLQIFAYYKDHFE